MLQIRKHKRRNKLFLPRRKELSTSAGPSLRVWTFLDALEGRDGGSGIFPPLLCVTLRRMRSRIKTFNTTRREKKFLSLLAKQHKTEEKSFRFVYFRGKLCCSHPAWVSLPLPLSDLFTELFLAFLFGPRTNNAIIKTRRKVFQLSRHRLPTLGGDLFTRPEAEEMKIFLLDELDADEEEEICSISLRKWRESPRGAFGKRICHLDRCQGKLKAACWPRQRNENFRLS